MKGMKQNSYPLNNYSRLSEESGPAYTSFYEHEIDRLVYNLYGLTNDEIAIVEGQGS